MKKPPCEGNMFPQAASLSGEGLSEKVSLHIKTREFVSTVQWKKILSGFDAIDSLITRKEIYLLGITKFLNELALAWCIPAVDIAIMTANDVKKTRRIEIHDRRRIRIGKLYASHGHCHCLLYRLHDSVSSVTLA